MPPTWHIGDPPISQAIQLAQDVVRRAYVPSGPVADIARVWSGEFPYDPAHIRIPVLMIRGEWDNVTTNDDAHWLWERLRNAPLKRDVIISRGTHVMHLEASRFQLYREVQTFVEGDDMASAM